MTAKHAVVHVAVDHAGREELVFCTRTSSKALCCVCVPHAHPYPIFPRFEVSETLFLLLVEEGHCSQNSGLFQGSPKACACQE